MSAHHTISHYFEADHERLDQIFKQFQKAKRASIADAKPFFKAFNNGLRRHIVWEESVLFPRFEGKTGMVGAGPTAVMRAEHRQIGGLLDSIHEKVRRGDPASEREEEALLAILSAHNQKEEHILYPAIDQLLGADEVALAFVVMEEIPEDRYQTCCGAL
jgi:iron-sulfur cluster repair protein YtfE (RIC family)